MALLAIAAVAIGPARAQDLTINSASDWDNFAAAVSAGDNFANKTVKLNADITVTTMVGTSAFKFAGTFDGGGHTLTVNYNTNENFVAPFRYLDGAAIKYLHVAGTITTSAQFAGGVVADSYGNSFVNSCWSSVTISSSRNGDGTSGGLVALARGNFTLKNCLFDGKLLTTNGTTNCGGFVGWRDNNLTVECCLYAPSAVDAGETWIGTANSCTFSRNGITYQQNTNYYTTAFGTEQGNAVGSMDNAALATALGAGWTVSGNKVVPVMTPHALSGNGSWQSPWLVASVTDWNNLAYNVNTIGDSYSDQFFKMTADVTVSDIVGTASISFCGSFDGDGHTLTFNKGTSGSPQTEEFCAPFRYTCNVTLTNLHIAGTIYTQGQKTAVIGRAHGTTTLTNCWSSIEINSSVNGDGTHAGFIGVMDNGGPTTLTNCLFDGKMLGSSTNNCGGFIGWTHSSSGISATFVNCLFDPTEMTVNTSGGCTYSRGYNRTYINSYYRQPLGEEQGTAVGSMSNADLAAALGSAWSVSGDKVVPVLSLWQGSGTESDPYLIATVNDWEMLSGQTIGGTTYGGRYFKLTNDITVTTMVARTNRFSGTFDGDGHTLTFNYTTTEDGPAPFRYTLGATIKNLHIAGSINTTMRYVGGLISESFGPTSIINCRNSVAITTACTGHQDITCGGYIAIAHGVTTFTGCLLDGSMTTTDDDNNCGGFLGWVDNGQSATFTDCLYAPANVTNGMQQMTFARGGGDRIFSKCYYTDTYGSTAQGIQARTVAGADGVSVAISGNATATYSVSGLTAYANGLQCGNVVYAAGGDNVSLNLGYSGEGRLDGFSADNGTLNGSANPYTLTLADANTLISADVTPIRSLTGIPEGWQVKVDSVDKTSAIVGDSLLITEGALVTLIPDNPRLVKSVTLKDEGPAVQTITVAGLQLNYVEGENWVQTAQRNPGVIDTDESYVTKIYGTYYLKAGSSVVSPTSTYDSSLGYWWEEW